MKKKTKELLIRCIDYTLYMKEIYFDKDDLNILNDLKYSIMNKKEVMGE